MSSRDGLDFRGHLLVARLDNLGDVLLAGPAVRAIPAEVTRCSFLPGPQGADAARLLPGVDEVLSVAAPLVADPPLPVAPDDIAALVSCIARRGIDAALIFTSFHQSPVPLALALRLAGVRDIAACCHDYPGSLLDRRVREPGAECHEAERALYLTSACGFSLPPGDDGRLRVTMPRSRPLVPLPTRSVVVHPGASQRARTASPRRWRTILRALSAAGNHCVVTGSTAEKSLVDEVSAALSAVTALAGQCARSRISQRSSQARRRSWSATRDLATSPRRCGRRSCHCSRRQCRRRIGSLRACP